MVWSFIAEETHNTLTFMQFFSVIFVLNTKPVLGIIPVLLVFFICKIKLNIQTKLVLPV